MISEDNFVDFKCPYCGDAVSFPRESGGYVEACPSCTESLIVPADGSAVGRKIPLPISTPRLVLRRFASGDWRDLLELMSDETLFEFHPGEPLDEEAVLRWVESEHHVRLTTPNQVYCLGLQLRGEEKLIGYIGLRLQDAQCQQATVSIFLNGAYRGQGAALEALQALLRFCFTDLNMHRLVAFADSRNAAALDLFKAAGFRREGEFVKDRLVHGEWVNTIWFAVLKEDLSGLAEAT